MSDDGKDIIAKMAKMLAPDQQDMLVVNGYINSGSHWCSPEDAGSDFEQNPLAEAC
jgi:hypothetical protein